MGFSREYSCYTIINIKHEWRLSLQLMTNWSLTSNYSNACLAGNHGRNGNSNTYTIWKQSLFCAQAEQPSKTIEALGGTDIMPTHSDICRCVCIFSYLLDSLIILAHMSTRLAQWLTWLTQGRCNPKVPSSIPAGGKDFPWARKCNHIALCLGGHIKVRVPGATIARKNTCVIITPQYYAPSEPSWV